MTGGRRAGPRRSWVAPACARLTWASLAKARLSTRHPLVLVVNYLIVGTAYLYRLSHAGGQGTPATIRVLIVDDQRLMRDGLRTLLELQDGLVVIGEAGDGSQALPLIEQLQPDVVLMDVRMPRMDGVEATRALTRRGPRPRVLVLTTFDDDQYVYEALQAMQVLPLVGWLVTRRLGHWSRRRQVALVWTAGLAYAGLILLLIWQALRGQSLLAPDGTTLAACAALLLATATAVAAIMAQSPKRSRYALARQC